ncbi:MAG: recombination protein O N-terminal domain-containing protein [Erythrobacter sp.]|nr:recombination protein O N-terminal domain-containing protein [Erythrobacter sp.]
MHLRAPAILVASRPYGETAAIARLLTEEHGLVAGYVAGGRGRQLRPVMIPGNSVALELRAKSASQLPFARLELQESRAPWMTEPLPAAAITWACALTATALPERNPYPSLYQALGALLTAICHAPSARGWLAAMNAYEAMLLRELGYGGAKPDMAGEIEAQFQVFRALHKPLERYILADSRSDVMAARVALGERLGRMLT